MKMAEVVDECPPLAKLFEAGLERFQQVFEVNAVIRGERFQGLVARHAGSPLVTVAIVAWRVGGRLKS